MKIALVVSMLTGLLFFFVGNHVNELAEGEWQGKFYDEFIERHGFGTELPLGRADRKVLKHELEGKTVFVAIKNQLWIESVWVENGNEVQRIKQRALPQVVPDIDLLGSLAGKSLPQLTSFFDAKLIDPIGIYRIEFEEKQFLLQCKSGIVMTIHEWSEDRQKFELFAVANEAVAQKDADRGKTAKE